MKRIFFLECLPPWKIFCHYNPLYNSGILSNKYSVILSNISSAVPGICFLALHPEFHLKVLLAFGLAFSLKHIPTFYLAFFLTWHFITQSAEDLIKHVICHRF